MPVRGTSPATALHAGKGCRECEESWMLSKRARAVGLLLLLGGCAHRARTAPVVAEEEALYRIGRDDVLDISVWREPDLSRLIPVRPDGFVSLPLAGELRAIGKTPAELAEEIRLGISPYVQDPKVTVIVRELNSSRIFVTGEVARPGVYPLRGRMSVLQAIALAGGFSDFADQDGIIVIREGGGRIPVRYSDLVAEEGEEESERRARHLLVPGDTVVVP